MEMARCLIVDDSSVIRKVAKRILSSADIMVTEAATGEEAIALSAHEMADIIIVDSSLPDMDSSDVVRGLMTLPSEGKPHILLCLSALDLGAIMRAKRAGAKGYMLKPFTRAQLLEHFREFRFAA
ncbi:response regulator [Nitratireductor indicus]|uniref:Response regulator receiver protein n=1 Tax=Nitratireductor indicus C115 TaxID=1231190 RepID=K2P0F7_9HYPH|nr:response regulator [Nitratireductor indicus]EKF43654.1 response regulator receiver protein [Nitratireductor indicus C115]MDS1135968.1 response regulator [Nitratireductor indicus]